MNKNLENIASELFGKLRTQFPKIQLGDANSAVTDRPKDARFFEFDFVKHGRNLGTISVSIDDNKEGDSDGLIVMFSNDIVEGQSELIKKQWFRFLESLSDFASSRMLDFTVRDISKSNLDKRDYKFLANNSGEGAMTESKLWGTSRTSFQEMGDAKLIVRHTKPVNYDLPAGRTMHIESIYVENAEGERFKYPYKHLNGARALATHVAHGGTSYDPIGQHIIGLSEELNKLRMFKGYVSRNPVVSEAMGTINDKVFERIDQVKKEIHSLQNVSYYKSFAESYTEATDQIIPEEIVNDWVDRLTIRSFNEELKNVFPYIYKLVGEEIAPVKELTADDLLFKEEQEELNYIDNSEVQEADEFESFLNSIVDEESNLLNIEDSQEEAIKKLNDLVSNPLPLGTDGTNAIQSLKGILDDKELEDAFRELGQVNPEMDAREILQSFLQKYDEENGTDIGSKINFGATPAPAEAPAATVAEPAAPAAPEQPAPVAETRFAQAVRKVAEAGMQLEDTFNFAGNEITLRDAIHKAGLRVDEFFTESADKAQQEIVEFIKSMYDETTGRFPKGETGVMIAVEKEFGEDATPLARHVIGELSTIYESKRLRQLAGLV